MKTYKETKEAYRQLILEKGFNNILGRDLVELRKAGHDGTNISRAHAYFYCSKQAAKYR